MLRYNLSNSKIIVGDLADALAINAIILITNKLIYSCMKKEQKPNILFVKNVTKKFDFQERYYHYISNVFDKKLITFRKTIVIYSVYITYVLYAM